MKNTPLHTLSRAFATFACLVILFLAGGWVGSCYPSINWMMATLGAIAVTALTALIWFVGRYSRGIPAETEEEDE